MSSSQSNTDNDDVLVTTEQTPKTPQELPTEEIVIDGKKTIVQREPFMVVLEEEDDARNAADKDAPFCFGPYMSRESAEEAVRLVQRYQEMDPDEPRLKCRIGTYKRPDLLRMFLAL